MAAKDQTQAPMSLRSYAKRRGVTVQAVSKAIDAGRLRNSVVRDARNQPKIGDADLADAEWAQNTDPRRPGSRDGGERVGADLMKARELREKFNAALAKLSYDERTGRLIDADEVRHALFEVARKTRDMLNGAPARIAPLLVGLDTPEAAHRILEQEIRRICTEIAAIKI